MDIASLVLIGLAAGLLGGLLGIGGSIVMIPAMTEVLGANQHLYQAAALIVNFFVAAPALWQHLRARAVNASVVRGLIPSAVVAAVAGVACSELPVFYGDRALYLTALFGCFLFYVAARDIIMMIRPPKVSAADADAATRIKRLGWRTALLVGLPTGFVSGFLGVGGGIMAVPLQRRFCRMPLRNAIANSAATIVALSLVSASLKHYALATAHPNIEWYRPMALAAVLIPTAIIGASIGGRLTHTLPVTWVRIAFIGLLIVAGVRMVLRGFGTVG